MKLRFSEFIDNITLLKTGNNSHNTFGFRLSKFIDKLVKSSCRGIFSDPMYVNISKIGPINAAQLWKNMEIGARL